MLCILLSACGSSPNLKHSKERFKNSYSVFESGQVRPLAYSKQGHLLVTNTPNNSLELFDLSQSKLDKVATVPVGIDPIAVASDVNYAWVVNHISDNLSVVQLGDSPKVINIIDLGDEPRDVLIAGENRQFLFVTSAHRGQNHPSFSPDDLHDPEKGKGSLWVFNLQDTLKPAPTPITIINLFGEVPRSLAASPDGKTVYAASFYSGNQSTLVPNKKLPYKKAGISKSADGVEQPATGLIIQYDGSHWRDDHQRIYDTVIDYEIADNDVFVIDADRSVPKLKGAIKGVGTNLFAMSVVPHTGELLIANTEANNLQRFEGSKGELTGRFIKNQISVWKEQNVHKVELNPHINVQGITDNPELSLSQPSAIEFSENAEEVLIAGLGSSRLIKTSTRQLLENDYAPEPSNIIELPSAGVSGLLRLDDRLFVYSFISNELLEIDTNAWEIKEQIQLSNPEPEYIKAGRRFLYDADYSSANGAVSCSGCHLYGDMDHLAWDLGNPDLGLLRNRNQFVPFLNPRASINFHPLKGPLATQTLKGMAENGPMHWRGDKMGRGANAESLENAALKEFNSAFVSLLGRESELTETEMQQFADFIFSLKLPPNPIRNLDNSLTHSQARGASIYRNDITTYDQTCLQCHVLNPKKSQFGTNGLSNGEADRTTQDFKVPQLRNLYQKTGMFRQSETPIIRGFGFTHDASFATLQDFFSVKVFKLKAESRKRQVADFIFAYDSDFMPITGQQTMLDGSPQAQAKLELMLSQSEFGGCRLVVTEQGSGQVDKWQFQPAEQVFISDARDKSVGLKTFINNEKASSHIFTCVTN